MLTKLKERAQIKQDKIKPQNLLSRLHFYELICRIAVHKYTMMPPGDCVKRFIHEHLKPGMKTKELRAALTPSQVLEELFLTNRDVKKLLFVNQFSLKAIYDQLAREDP